MIEHFKLKLVDSFMLAPSVRHLVFERVDGQPLAFKPGQFLQVHFHYDDGKATKRSYSVATVGEEGADSVQHVEIAVSYVEGGAATRLFAELEHDGSIEASGPYGRFCLQDTDENKRYLLVATGTGVTPFRAMMPQIARAMRDHDRRFVLLYGARNEAELLYGEEFEALAREHENFQFHACLSRGARPDPRSDDRLGYVQSILPELEPDAENDIAYLCGNPEMVDAAFAELKERGLSVRQIRREKYISSR